MSLPQSLAVAADELERGYRTAMLDWLGCAVGGRDERATRAARSASFHRSSRMPLNVV
jgi:2-methylcitrate dehydratase PrpD